MITKKRVDHWIRTNDYVMLYRCAKYLVYMYYDSVDYTTCYDYVLNRLLYLYNNINFVNEIENAVKLRNYLSHYICELSSD